MPTPLLVCCAGAGAVDAIEQLTKLGELFSIGP
jgi:hypothetical protein